MARYSYGASGSTHIVSDVRLQYSPAGASGGAVEFTTGHYRQAAISCSVGDFASYALTVEVPGGVFNAFEVASGPGVGVPTPYFVVDTLNGYTRFNTKGVQFGSGTPLYMGSSNEIKFSYDEGATETVLVEVDGFNGRGMTFATGSALYFGKGPPHGEPEALIQMSTDGWLQLSGTMNVSGTIVGTDCSQTFYLSSSLTASCDSLVYDFKKIYFGDSHDSYIGYNGYFLEISGAVPGGIALSGAIYTPHLQSGYAPTGS